MNKEMVKGVVERVVTIGLAYLVGKGVIPESAVGDIVLIAGTVVSVIWGIVVNRNTALTKAAQATK